jgi:hypothetical protein
MFFFLLSSYLKKKLIIISWWGGSGMFPVHMCWVPDAAYYTQHITEEGHKLGRPVEKFATVGKLLTLL